jgi:hypothetical protein
MRNGKHVMIVMKVETLVAEIVEKKLREFYY